MSSRVIKSSKTKHRRLKRKHKHRTSTYINTASGVRPVIITTTRTNARPARIGTIQIFKSQIASLCHQSTLINVSVCGVELRKTSTRRRGEHSYWCAVKISGVISRQAPSCTTTQHSSSSSSTAAVGTYHSITRTTHCRYNIPQDHRYTT